MPFPSTRRQPFVDTYHGIPVDDPYRWLEDASDPAVHAWTQAQKETTRAYLDQIPFRERVYEQVRHLRGHEFPHYFNLITAGGRRRVPGHPLYDRGK